MPILYQKGNKTSSYYNTNKAGIINAGPYTGLTVAEAKDLNTRQHADYRANLNKAEAEEGARIVREGTDQFAKDYLHPAIKFAGAFNPIAGPMIGLTDAYQSYKAGNTGAAVVGAGLEALPYGGKYIAKGVGKIISTNLPAITDHAKGITRGVKEVIGSRGTIKRPFFEVFPVTKSQIAKVYEAQDKAHQDGIDFVTKWNYSKGNFNLRPEVRTRLDAIEEGRSLGGNTVIFRNDNPVVSGKNLLISSRRNQIKRSGLSADHIKDIYTNRGHIRGINLDNSNPFKLPTSVTLRNLGFYHFSPNNLKNTAAHEAGHSMQTLGNKAKDLLTGQKGWISNLSINDNSLGGYTSANPNTEVGKKFKTAMIDAVPGKYVWEASPSELHSEVMVARMNLKDRYIKDLGIGEDMAFDRVKDMDDDITEYIANRPNVLRFFKPETSLETRKSLIKLLPAYAGAAYLTKQE